MSYERQRTVRDQQEVIGAGDLAGRVATNGVLIHGVCNNGLAQPMRVRGTGEAATMDITNKEMLFQILIELRKMNLHLLSITDEHFSEPDIDSNY